jgi:hypothetical protein
MTLFIVRARLADTEVSFYYFLYSVLFLSFGYFGVTHPRLVRREIHYIRKRERSHKHNTAEQNEHSIDTMRTTCNLLNQHSVLCRLSLPFLLLFALADPIWLIGNTRNRISHRYKMITLLHAHAALFFLVTSCYSGLPVKALHERLEFTSI